MPLDDRDGITPWTRAQLWDSDDARNQRTHGPLLTAILAASWLVATIATYPRTAPSAAEPPNRMQPPGMHCYVGDRCSLHEALELRRSLSPAPLCVSRTVP